MKRDVVWEDPPPIPAPVGRRPVDPRWAEMKAHPGKWLLWNAAAKSGGLRYFQDKGFQASTRKNADGTYRMYVRWPDD